MFREVSEVQKPMKDLVKLTWYQTTSKHNKWQTMCTVTVCKFLKKIFIISDYRYMVQSPTDQSFPPVTWYVNICGPVSPLMLKWAHTTLMSWGVIFMVVFSSILEHRHDVWRDWRQEPEEKSRARIHFILMITCRSRSIQIFQHSFLTIRNWKCLELDT